MLCWPHGRVALQSRIAEEQRFKGGQRAAKLLIVAAALSECLKFCPGCIALTRRLGRPQSLPELCGASRTLDAAALWPWPLCPGLPWLIIFFKLSVLMTQTMSRVLTYVPNAAGER